MRNRSERRTMLYFWQSANNSSTLFRKVVVAPLVFMLLPICSFVCLLRFFVN